MKTIEINCLECRNCTGDSCKVYGSNADKAVKSCADDSFRNYKARMTREEDCESCQYYERNADQYPCSHCRNCYPSKFKAKLDGRENENHGG
ncbi:MAG: hypothetical protein SOW50_05030 [Lachnospiraceae bacterium]|nr:hypothetical protein [Lachnospiraceae bacterium]